MVIDELNRVITAVGGRAPPARPRKYADALERKISLMRFSSRTVGARNSTSRRWLSATPRQAAPREPVIRARPDGAHFRSVSARATPAWPAIDSTRGPRRTGARAMGPVLEAGPAAPLALVLPATRIRGLSRDMARHRSSRKKPSRDAPGWRVSNSLRTAFVLDALEQAIYDRRGDGSGDLVHHTTAALSLSMRYTESAVNRHRASWQFATTVLAISV